MCFIVIRDGIVPATINLDNPIEEVGDFDLVPNKAKKRDVMSLCPIRSVLAEQMHRWR